MWLRYASSGAGGSLALSLAQRTYIEIVILLSHAFNVNMLVHFVATESPIRMYSTFSCVQPALLAVRHRLFSLESVGPHWLYPNCTDPANPTGPLGSCSKCSWESFVCRSGQNAALRCHQYVRIQLAQLRTSRQHRIVSCCL